MGAPAKHRIAGFAPKGPAAGVILGGKERTRRSKGVTQKNSFSVTFTAEHPLYYNFDMRWLVNEVTLAYAYHFSDSLKRGVRPDGFGRLPKVKDSTLKNDMFEGRTGDWVGMRTGWMANHWWVGKIGGTAVKAHRLVKPTGPESSGGDLPDRKRHNADKSRSATINKLLDAGVDFQSVRGKAARVAAAVIEKSIPQMVGHRIGVPTGVDTSPGTIATKPRPK